MNDKKMHSETSLLIRRFLSKNIELSLDTREIWLLTCSALFLENPKYYSSKEDILISYNEIPLPDGRYFSFAASININRVEIRAGDYYKDIEGVYNNSAHVFTIENNENKRFDEKDSGDNERLKRFFEDVNFIIEQERKPRIYSNLQEIKITKKRSLELELAHLKNSIEFEKKYGSESKASRLQKKLEILIEKTTQSNK